MEPLTKDQLENLKCDNPECDHGGDCAYLQAKCHLDTPPLLRYAKRLGALVLECSVCHRDIAMVKVGEVTPVCADGSPACRVYFTPFQVKAVDGGLETAIDIWGFDAKRSGDPRCAMIIEGYVKTREAIRAQLDN